MIQPAHLAPEVVERELDEFFMYSPTTPCGPDSVV